MLSIELWCEYGPPGVAVIFARGQELGEEGNVRGQKNTRPPLEDASTVITWT